MEILRIVEILFFKGVENLKKELFKFGSLYHSEEITEILSHQKIFREINSFVIYLVKTLFSRNFCQKYVRENFHNFHTVCITFLFSSNQLISILRTWSFFFMTILNLIEATITY